MTTKQWIVDWFIQNTHATQEDILAHLDDNYFEAGWMDSLKFIGFLTALEDNFNVEFDNSAFQDRAFSSISGLAKMIDELL